MRLTIKSTVPRYGAATVDTKGRKRVIWSDPFSGLLLMTFSHDDTFGTVHGTPFDFTGTLMFKPGFSSNQWPIPNSYEHLVGQWSGQLGHLNLTATSSNGFVIRSNNWNNDELNYYVACEIKHVSNGKLNVTAEDLGKRVITIIVDVDFNTLNIEPNWESHERFYFHGQGKLINFFRSKILFQSKQNVSFVILLILLTQVLLNKIIFIHWFCWQLGVKL